MGERLHRAATAIIVVACALALSIAAGTDVAHAKKKKQKPDAFDNLKAQTTFDQPKPQSNVEQKKDSDSNDNGKQSGEKGEDTPSKYEDNSAKTAQKTGKNSEESSEDTKKGQQKAAAGDGVASKPGRRQTETADDAPPKTVEEWLKGFTKPQLPAIEPVETEKSRPQVKPVLVEKPSRIEKPVEKPIEVAKPPQKPTPAEPSTHKPSTPKPSTHIVADRPLALDAPRAEVLANNLSKESLKLATDQGFVFNGKAALAQLDKTFTKLGAPVGMSAKEAAGFLAQLLPAQELGANEAYLIYKPSTANPAKPDTQEVPPPAAMPTTCGTDRCFAQTLIGWRPQLQACTRNVRVGVIDTGIDQTHPAFQTRRIEARPAPKVRTVLKRQVAPKWHGTGVLALLAGEPQSATPGLISDASFYVADVFYADADGLPVSDTASILEALNWLALKHVNIVNMSLTGPHDPLLKAAIEDLSKKGMIFVAAVGNDGPGAPPTYPSAYPPVVAVSAVNKEYANYRYANRGDHVDLAAPGVDIWTAMPDAQGAYHSGTSFAVPYATAMLASVFHSLAAKTKADALAKLSYVDLGVPGRDPVYGRGLAIAPYGCEIGPGTPLKPAPQQNPVNVTSVKN